MAHAQKPEFVNRRNGRVHLNQWGRKFSRLLAAEVCASAVVMLDTPFRGSATHSIRQFPLHFPTRASPCAITFQLESTSQCFERPPLLHLQRQAVQQKSVVDCLVLVLFSEALLPIPTRILGGGIFSFFLNTC